MKKRLIIIGALIVLVLACLYFKYIFGWIGFIKNRDTPEAFLNHTVAAKGIYTKDSVEILNTLRYFLKSHQQSFHSEVYYDSTKLSIDTILYSPDFSKLAAFVITRNPTSRQEMPDLRYDWHYDGYCYFGTKQKDSIDLIYLDSGFGSNFRKKVTESLRTNYFRLFATIKDISGEYKYGYNLDDIRFWSCPVWKEIDDIKQQNRAFENEKKNHPENVFEPKR
jgi:hypothetical protein